MRKHHSQLPIILILVVLLTAAEWAVAQAGARSSATLRSGVRTGGGVVALSGDPDSPGSRGGGDGKAGSGSATTQRRSDLWSSLLSDGHWYRLIQVRLLGY